MSDTSSQPQNSQPITDSTLKWTITWLNASICACLWRGGKRLKPSTKLWEAMLADDETPRGVNLTERLNRPKTISDPSSLAKKIEEIAIQNKGDFKPDYGWTDGRWYEGMKVGAATWGDTFPKIGDGWDVAQNRAPRGANSNVLTVLTPEGLFLTMEGIKGHPTDGKIKFEVKPSTSGRRPVKVGRQGNGTPNIDLDLTELKWEPPAAPPSNGDQADPELPREPTDFWLDPYLEVLDNRLLNCDEGFRNQLNDNAQSETDKIQEIIEDAAKNLGFLNFHHHFPAITYAVEPNRAIKRSTIAWDGERYHVTLGLEEADHKQCAGENEDSSGHAPLRESVSDWPCGSFRDP